MLRTQKIEKTVAEMDRANARMQRQKELVDSKVMQQQKL